MRSITRHRGGASAHRHAISALRPRRWPIAAAQQLIIVIGMPQPLNLREDGLRMFLGPRSFGALHGRISGFPN
jgi:hypothetical protein